MPQAETIAAADPGPLRGDRGATLAALRERIARIAPVRAREGRLSTGIQGLDDVIGGWPRPGLSELVGRPGSGRLGLALPLMVELTQRRQLVVLLDGRGWLHPPGLPGVDLEHVLLIRPGQSRAGWAAEQVARSGAAPLLVVVDGPPLGRGGRRLQHAAEEGGCVVLTLSERADPDLPAALRLEVAAADRILIRKDGRGARERVVALDIAPRSVLPFQAPARPRGGDRPYMQESEGSP